MPFPAVKMSYCCCSLLPDCLKIAEKYHYPPEICRQRAEHQAGILLPVACRLMLSRFFKIHSTHTQQNQQNLFNRGFVGSVAPYFALSDLKNSAAECRTEAGYIFLKYARITPNKTNRTYSTGFCWFCCVLFYLSDKKTSAAHCRTDFFRYAGITPNKTNRTYSIGVLLVLLRLLSAYHENI
jgi:hypothetical protein